MNDGVREEISAQKHYQPFVELENRKSLYDGINSGEKVIAVKGKPAESFA